MDIYVDIFDAASIDQAIQKLETYRDGLEPKLIQVLDEATEKLNSMVESGFNGAPYDDIVGEGYSEAKVSVYSQGEGLSREVVADGVEAAFVEFGAGVYKNPSGYPGERPAGIKDLGEYGHGYGKRRVWGFFVGEGKNKQLKLTRGTPASAPMYHATQAIKEEIPEIARRIFEESR